MKDFGIIITVLAVAYVISNLGNPRNPTSTPVAPAAPNPLLLLSVPQNPGVGPLSPPGPAVLETCDPSIPQCTQSALGQIQLQPLSGCFNLSNGSKVCA